MLNILWAGMMLIGIFWAAIHGNLEAVTDGALESAKEAVTLCITMLGIMSFWSGILKIGENTGLIGALTQKMKPMIRFLFPRLPEDHPAAAYISANMIANMLGLGWAATPAGLRAMEELKNLEEEHELSEIQKTDENAVLKKLKMTAYKIDTASDEMCTFLVINISSLQLIPMNMIAYRSQYGSTDPSSIVGPVLLATTLSTLTGVVFVKIIHMTSSGCQNKRRDKNHTNIKERFVWKAEGGVDKKN